MTRANVYWILFYSKIVRLGRGREIVSAAHRDTREWHTNLTRHPVRRKKYFNPPTPPLGHRLYLSYWKLWYQNHVRACRSKLQFSPQCDLDTILVYISWFVVSLLRYFVSYFLSMAILDHKFPNSKTNLFRGVNLFYPSHNCLTFFFF